MDSTGAAYVTGRTGSTDFPTQNPYQGDQGGDDVFVTKLSPDGQSLIYSTYLGGGGADIGYGIAVDSSGNAYVTGWTESTDFPTQNPYQGSNAGSFDAFVTKLADIQRLTWTSGDSRYTSIAIDSNGSIHMVWQDDTPGNSEIYYKRSTDGGATWTWATRLTWTAGASYNPAIAIDSADNIHVVWDDWTPGNSEIYYKRSTDGGATWTWAKRLTWTQGDSLRPDIAIDSTNNIHIVWDDRTPGNSEIYYKRSTDGGATWSADMILTNTLGNSRRPAIAIDLVDNIHVVWDDDTPGNFEIYYLRP